MTLEPLLTASPAIQLHAFTAMAAFGLGIAVLLARKGTAAHRLMGRIWVGLMVVTALSSFLVHTLRMIGPFSPIHILSVVTLYGSFAGVRAARRRDFKAHARSMQRLFAIALVGAGIFTLVPGRIMGEVFFSGGLAVGSAILVVIVAILAWTAWLAFRRGDRTPMRLTGR